MHHFFVTSEQIHGEQLFFSREQTHQLCRVLRMDVGQNVVAFAATAVEYTVQLTQVNPQQVLGEIVGQRPSPNEPKPQITLFQSLSKRDKFEWVLQKGTEVGVTHFVPLVTQRSLVQNTQLKVNKLNRWHKIITEAAEQAHRGRVPQITPPQRLRDALSGLDMFDLALMAQVGAQRPLRTILTDQTEAPLSIALFIGPEGGFSDKEWAAAEAVGVRPFTLGPRILRTETAAVVAAALILYELGVPHPLST